MLRAGSALASLRLTLGVFIFLGLSIMLAYFNEVRTSPWLVLSLSMLAINLLAAIATNQHFRRQLPLMCFHLALLAIVLLIALGRLTYFKGRAEVVDGEEFTGQFVDTEAGPWHPLGAAEARFTNLGTRIVYAPGPVRLGTENHVAWVDENGVLQRAVIGDHNPLIRHHYRFYANWNKGFALMFGWQPKQGAPLLGSVNLPSYPANALQQARQWSLPGNAEPIWAALHFDDQPVPEAGGEFHLPEHYTVVVRQGSQRWELAGEPGTGDIELPGGRLSYLGLRTWMGYQVAWDRTMPWLLAASLTAVLALAWHFWQKFSGRSWNA
ncbi:MAG: cytochrome c biosis protein ResB [Proteobacteria bacterium]|nr:cytochrome c biosis protein ResB [Pseudomonadota bacterium]